MSSTESTGPVPLVEFDAPLEERAELDAWVTGLRLTEANGTPRPDRFVVAAGRAARVAPGDRAPRAAAAAGGVDAGARGNWIPTGPRNITGRVRALAVHPTDPTVMYAGAASGGIYKSIDGGETWFPSWTDGASASIAAISICRTHPEVVWVATGEIQAGGGESILGTGIYRSLDSGASWTKIDNPGAAGAATLPTTFDGLAAHPTNRAACWAVGPQGIFRILAEVSAGGFWAQFAAGDYYSDVAFSVDTAAPPQPVVFLVRAISAAGETTVVRVDKPDDTVPNVTAAIGPPKVPPAPAGVPNPANASNPSPAPGVLPPQAQTPIRGKIAICAGTPSVAFVRFARNDRSPGRPQHHHFGIFRTQNAQAPPVAGVSAVAWTQIPDDAGFAVESQGNYDLAIGVNPNNPNEIATGMQDVYVSTNANGPAAAVTFNRAIAEDITFFDRAQHADQHTTLIVPPPVGAPAGTPPTLWVSNDGGISRSLDWQTGASYVRGSTVLPLPAGVITWRKSFGISVAQPYSISQSPLLPTVFGCGFQDNGVLFTSGGPTWRTVLGADGGFIAFDPDDPYKLLATHQFTITEDLFPGKLEGGFALPGFAVREGLWPRVLSQGFLPSDGGLFVGDVIHHPRHGDRVLYARENRLYGSTEALGDRWVPETAGRGVELQVTVPSTAVAPTPTSTLVVQVTPAPGSATGAARLGMPPQVATVQSGAGSPAVASIRSMLPAPYALQDGDTLNLTANGTPLAVVFNRPAEKHGVPWTAAEVATTITAAATAAGMPALVAHPCFWPHPWLVEVTTTELGANAQITLGGSALNPPASGLPALGLRARTYHGSANRPATVTLIATTNLAPPAGQPPLELTLKIGAGGDTRTVTFNSDTFADLAFVHAGELQRAIKAALHDDPAIVTAHAVEKRLRLAATVGNLTLGGTAAPRLNDPNWSAATPTAAVFEPTVNVVNSFNLAPPTAGPGANVPLQLTINDGVHPVSTLTFNGTQNDLRTLTVEDLELLLQNQLAGPPVLNATCTLELFPDTGEPTEITYSTAAPDTAWVGSTDGTLYKTTNDGGLWETIADPLVFGLSRAIEAIAIHPSDPDTVYVGLEGRPTLFDVEDPAPLTKPGLLFKTTNAGSSWSHVGGDVKDTTGGLLGVYALEIDPAAPDTVFAATEVGVFRSTDAASSWHPFNEGLPSAIVRDLAFVPERRVLRAGVWGRGSYEREVGSPTAKDVVLYVRANDLDDGSVRPVPRGPDVYAGEPKLLPPAGSPDIKVNRDDPPTVVGGRLIDGVEFDDDVIHEDIVSGAATVFVQVHNRGAFDATAVRVVCLWADASTGPPPLPADFWTRFHAKNFGGLDPSWTLVADTTLTDPQAKGRDHVPPGYPRVLRLPVNWPADISTHRRVGILLLVESAEDQLGALALDVGALLESEPKVAYRETGTVSDLDDQTILLRQTSAAQFTVAAPTAPLSPGTAVLQPGAVLTLPAAGFVLGDTQATFALAPVAGNNQALTFAVPTQTVTVTFNNGMFNRNAVQDFEVADIINHQLFKSGAPLGIDPNQLSAGNLVLQAGAGSVFQVTGGTAAPILGFAVGGLPVTTLAGIAPPYNLAGPPAPTLVISITPQATVQFAAQPGFNPAAAPARTVRRLLNRELAAAHMPIRCVTPRIDLWIRRSITDADGIPSPVASRGFADLVASPAAVVGAPAQAALFDLVKVHGRDLVRPGNDNFLYLRVANLGNNDLADAPVVNSRHRLFAVAITASPITLTQIGADVHQPVPAESSTVVEFHWNPGAVATGDRLFVLAVSDDQTHRPLTKSAAPLTAATTFATVDELDQFCAANPNAAYRMFVVGT